jgi:hypothetical protein
MSRTINDILADTNEAQTRVNELYAALTDAVDADANLDGLDSTSKTADYNLWKFVFSAMCYIQEGVVDEALAELQAIADSGITGIDPWYQAEVFKFQYGDALSWDNVNKKYYYAVIDPTKQIVKRCSVTSITGLTTIKAAKEVAGNPAALSTPELNALKSYVSKFQFSGTNIRVKSGSSDLLNAPITIYYDGTLVLADLQTLVQAAFTNYLASLPFNGEFNITKCEDAIQAVLGVNDVVMGAIQAKPNGGTYSTVARVYYPLAGYIQKDPAIDYSVMFTYVAQ